MNKLLYLTLMYSNFYFAQNLSDFRNLSFKFTCIDSCGKVKSLVKNEEPLVIIHSYKKIIRPFKRFDGYITIKSQDKNDSEKSWCDLKVFFTEKGNFVTLFWGLYFKPNNNFEQISSNLFYWFTLAVNSKGEIQKSQNQLIFNMSNLNRSGDKICIAIKLEIVP